MNRNIKFTAYLCLVLFVGLVQSCQRKSAPANSDWKPLFNGKDLSGWDIKIAGQPLNDNYKNTFRVQDSMIRIMYNEYTNFNDKYGHMYYETPYSHYLLRFQYRFTGEQTKGGASWNVRNSGVMVHSQSAASLNFGQDFPVSVEVQLLGGLGQGERATGNVCTPGTQVHMNGSLRLDHCINSNSKTYNGDQWVNVTVLVLGDSIVKHIVEGDTVLTYEKLLVGGGYVGENHRWGDGHFSDSAYWMSRQNTPLKTGYIALQAESHPIDFRRIELLDLEGCLDRKARNYKSYFVKGNNALCIY